MGTLLHLALTGWRRGEALTLRWGMVDLARRTARLADTKTGESLRPLSAAACDVLRQQGLGPANALVFPPSRGDGRVSGFPSLFERIAKAGGLPTDVTPHVLRNSFMSPGNDLHSTEATIGMICGHKGHGGGSMTRGYIHAGGAVFPAADRIRVLSRAAFDVVRALGDGDPDALVFRASRGDRPMTGFPSLFARIAKPGGLATDVTPHVHRHSFASLANDLGFTEAMVGMLVGHRGHGMTGRYLHCSRDVLLAAADKVANATTERMGGAGASATVYALFTQASA
jgi:integrase